MGENVLDLAQRGFAAWRQGDVRAIEAMLDPNVEWRWFEPGPWDCRNREDVVRTLRDRYNEGFGRGDVQILEAGEERVIALAHPSQVGGPEWPDETATLITFRGGKVVAMQDYKTLDEAQAAAQA